MSRQSVWGFLAGLLVGLLIAGAVGLVAISAEQRRTMEAREAAIENEVRASQAEKEAKENLKRAEDNLKLAKKAINETFDMAKNDPLFQKAEMHEVRKKLLEKALPFYKELREKK